MCDWILFQHINAMESVHQDDLEATASSRHSVVLRKACPARPVHACFERELL